MEDTLFKLSRLKKEQLNKVLRLIDKMHAKNNGGDDDDDEDDEEPVKKPTKPIKATTRRNHDDTDKFKGESVGERLRRERKNPTNKVNRFDNFPEKKQAKQDVKIDKLLWKGRTPTERPDQIEFVTANCEGCGKAEKVSPAFVYNDGDGNVKYKCNKCSASQRKK